jgi:hypothetical protein
MKIWKSVDIKGVFMKTAVMEKTIDRPIDLPITHVEKNKIIRSFWIKGGANE